MRTPPGEAAAHADDDDRVVVSPAGPATAVTGGVAAENLGQEELGQGSGVRVVEHQGGGQAQPGRGVEAVAQLDRGQRVEAEVGERPVAPTAGAGVSEHGGDVLADQVQQHARAFGRRTREQPGGQCAAGRGRGLEFGDDAADGGQVGQQRAAADAQQGPQDVGVLDVGDDELRGRPARRRRVR